MTSIYHDDSIVCSFQLGWKDSSNGGINKGEKTASHIGMQRG